MQVGTNNQLPGTRRQRWNIPPILPQHRQPTHTTLPMPPGAASVRQPRSPRVATGAIG
ncbi:hypothetical protein CLU88_2414 [Acidovorax sp. 56]|uniref:hypothetical protein n=1 Tax=Acidovorax sp. 56 TaxID=2035205 RepID=UPI000C655812|nr:hypothetical protein [Acidovorax sp. 56]PIF27517.1 hypothetical protein CLU88_2414 [Acidovorax sp. 56]